MPFFSSLFFSTNWKIDVRAGAGAAIWDHKWKVHSKPHADGGEATLKASWILVDFIKPPYRPQTTSPPLL